MFPKNRYARDLQGWGRKPEYAHDNVFRVMVDGKLLEKQSNGEHKK